jgi:hypothetical protein
MQIRLTQKGRKALNWPADRITANVSDSRAFAMMNSGLANPDKGFMALFDRQKPKPKPKKEKAVSKKAVNRKKAVKK